MSAGQVLAGSATSTTVFANIFATTLPQGLTAISIGGTAITGATPGTYPLTPVGGSLTGVQANLVVTSATAASVQIVNPGLGSGTTAPTFTNPAGATLPSGTTITGTVGPLVANQKTYWVVSADGTQLLLYGNNGGSVTSTPIGAPQPVQYLKPAVDNIASLLRAQMNPTTRWIPGNAILIGDKSGNYVANIGAGGVSLTINDNALSPTLLSNIRWLRGFMKLVRTTPGAQTAFGDAAGNFTTSVTSSGIAITEASLDPAMASDTLWLRGLRKILRFISPARLLFGDGSGNFTGGTDQTGTLGANTTSPGVTSVGSLSQITNIGTVISDGTANDYRPTPVNGHIRFTSDRDGGAVKPYRMLPNGKNVLQANTAVSTSFDGASTVYLLISYGQSLSIGTSPSVAAALTTAAHPGAVLRFNSGIRWDGALQTMPSGNTLAIAATNIDHLTPSAAQLDSATYGETHLETLAYRLFSSSGLRSIAAAPGIGGATITQLSSGTVPYANLLSIVERARDIVATLGWKLNVIIDFVHGNADAAASEATYQAALQALYGSLTTDISAITEQTALQMFVRQVATIGQSQVPLAQLAFANANANVHLTAPDYDLPFCADNTHPTSLGYTYMGDQEFRAINAVVAQGQTWSPLQPNVAAVSRSGAVITVPMLGATGNLVIDTTNVPAQSHYGLSYTDTSGSPPTISSVTVSGTNLIVTLSTAPSAGAVKTLSAGWPVSGISYTNICDSDPLTSTHGGVALPKRLAIFQINIS